MDKQGIWRRTKVQFYVMGNFISKPMTFFSYALPRPNLNFFYYLKTNKWMGKKYMIVITLE